MNKNEIYLPSTEANSSFSDKFYLFDDLDDLKWKKKKQSKREFHHRLIEKSANTVLDTASDIAKMYAESKLFPSSHGK